MPSYGQQTIPLCERMEMLVQHRQALNEQIARLQEHKTKLDGKIELQKEPSEQLLIIFHILFAKWCAFTSYRNTVSPISNP